MVTAGPIDAYVASLRGALRGPRTAKADLVAEARDGLIDAAARYEDDGLDRVTAERAAVEEFGPVADLVPEFQRELALTQGRRTAIVVGAAIAAQSVVSELAWRHAATGWTWQPGRAYAILANTVDYAAYAVVAGALLAALACGIGGRYVSVGRKFVRATGIAAIGIVGFFIAGGILLSAFSPTWTTWTTWTTWSGHTGGTSPLSMAAATLTMTLPAWMAYSGLRCVRASATR
ncbi:permease prefix domain 1-containing protein [Dactylosporangium sp. NPDC048998]|uniref:permease prefix domain 1-containing protein n=1 Tax=Dactylosporangium sp. NPDC048998 TaxID=3363976 RepID=UPI00371B703F